MIKTITIMEEELIKLYLEDMEKILKGFDREFPNIYCSLIQNMSRMSMIKTSNDYE